MIGEYINGQKIDKINNDLNDFNSINASMELYKNKSSKPTFESEYLDGKKNGKVKEYNGDKLIFEGEYLYGKKMEKEKNIIHLMAI